MDGTEFQGKKVLITGGVGFIGSNLAHRLLELAAQVTVVDSLIPEYGGNLFNVREISDDIRINLSDVRDEYSLRALLQGQDYLFNLAGQTSHMDSMQDPATDLDINCRAQMSILECCRHFNPEIKIVFASTRQIYGKPDYLPVDEKHHLRPVDVNGINKMAGEFYHLLYNQVYGLRSCALRLTNTYGPRMRIKDARQTFLGVWIRRAVCGEPFEVWEGGQRRDLTYVDDVVEALLMAAASQKADGRVFNIGGNCVVTLTELANLLAEAHGSASYTVKAFPADRKAIDIGDYYADDRAIRETLGWKPVVSLREGLERTLEYYRANLSEYI